MDLKAIRELAQKHTVEELSGFADELENKGSTSCTSKQDANEAMSNILQAMEVRGMIDSGMSLQEAVREFSKRVRTVLS